MLKKIEIEEAPKAIGPYSQAIRAGSFLFVSGQIPIDPMTGSVVESTIEKQTKQVLHNIQSILNSEGLDFMHVVKVEIYLKDLEDFSKVNALYSEKFLSDIKPARQTMQVSRLPLDVLIEISCIAYYE